MKLKLIIDTRRHLLRTHGVNGGTGIDTRNERGKISMNSAKKSSPLLVDLPLMIIIFHHPVHHYWFDKQQVCELWRNRTTTTTTKKACVWSSRVTWNSSSISTASQCSVHCCSGGVDSRPALTKAKFRTSSSCCCTTCLAGRVHTNSVQQHCVRRHFKKIKEGLKAFVYFFFRFAIMLMISQSRLCIYFCAAVRAVHFAGQREGKKDMYLGYVEAKLGNKSAREVSREAHSNDYCDWFRPSRLCCVYSVWWCCVALLLFGAIVAVLCLRVRCCKMGRRMKK